MSQDGSTTPTAQTTITAQADSTRDGSQSPKQLIRVTSGHGSISPPTVDPEQATIKDFYKQPSFAKQYRSFREYPDEPSTGIDKFTWGTSPGDLSKG